jgi:hypothetical protein
MELETEKSVLVSSGAAAEIAEIRSGKDRQDHSCQDQKGNEYRRFSQWEPVLSS